MPQTYAAGDSFSTFFSAFSSGFSSCWGFITENQWLLVICAVPVVLGLLAAVMSFIRSR